jgi:hypothetical protein
MGTPEGERIRKGVEAARMLGYCSSVSVHGRICNRQPHDSKTPHRAEHKGGPEDGKLYEEWGW